MCGMKYCVPYDVMCAGCVRRVGIRNGLTTLAVWGLMCRIHFGSFLLHCTFAKFDQVLQNYPNSVAMYELIVF